MIDIDVTILVRTDEIKERLIHRIESLPVDETKPVRVRFDCPLPLKSRDMEAKYHAMIGDIATQYKHCGKTFSAEDMKRLLIYEFKRETLGDPDFVDLWDKVGKMQTVPSLRGDGVVILGAQSRKFPSKLAAAFIEWLYAFGAEPDVNIIWSDPKQLAIKNQV